mgnify:CR=1 FL=1
MKINKTFIEDLLIIEPQLFKDERGFFYESYNKNNLDINIVFVQDNESKSSIGVLRGFHFQHKFQQGKFVNVIKGKILDCVIDLRKNSKTFGKVFRHSSDILSIIYIMNNIPKIVHFYWGKNNPLTFLQYLSVVSFREHNPGWKIKIYYPLLNPYVKRLSGKIINIYIIQS